MVRKQLLKLTRLHTRKLPYHNVTILKHMLYGSIKKKLITIA